MTDQPTTGTPATGSPGGDAPGNTGGSFVRDRTVQMLDKMQGARPSQGEQPAGEPAADARRQQPPPAESKIKIGDAEYDAADVQSAIAERAEAQVRKQALPNAPEGYEARNSANFQLPEGVKWEFNEADPALSSLRKFAMAKGWDQETFSGALDLFVSTQVGGLMNQQQARQKNLDALGAAGVQRIAAVSTWLKSIAGKDGSVVADFITQFPSAPIVRSLETVIRRFSNQGGADFSQSHRENQAEEGKIPGYDGMSFTEKRVHQMAAMLSKPGYRGGRGRNER